MIPQLPPYSPTEYLPGSYGRYRQYPRVVDTPIPGAGYDVGRMAWAEQELNLNNARPQDYGNYAVVPLRGIGTTMAPASMAMLTRLRATSPVIPVSVPTAPRPEEGGFVEPDVSPEAEAAEIEQMIAQAPAAPAEVGFMQRKIGPVPMWAAALGGVAVLGGGAFWLMRRKKVKPNRRRRRRR
jgi:hypothetical protein